MENMVRATLISNAGLLLEYREVKLLVDAIYHTTDPFSPPRQPRAPALGNPAAILGRAENPVDSAYSTDADGGLSNSGRDRYSTLFYPAY